MPSQQDPSFSPSPESPSYQSFQSPTKSFREHVSRRRAWLCVAAILLLLIMCAGIVVVTHHYYVDFGGQGYLKARDVDATMEVDTPKVYLPLRKVATFSEDHSRVGRSPIEVPFYACGDQQSSCEAYNQPDICCPVKMTCHSTPLTPSNIYCCSSDEIELVCDNSGAALAACPPSYVECLAEEGGGCCPMNSLCSPIGCITTTGPTAISQSGSTPTGHVTIIEVPAATATIMKQGEVVQSGVGRKDSVVVKLCLPYSCMSFLVFVAALMGFS